jgi:hypothetical protein
VVGGHVPFFPEVAVVKRLAYALTMAVLVLAQPTSAKATPPATLSCGGGDGMLECWWYNPAWVCYDQGTFWYQLCNPKKYPLCGSNGWPE